MFRFLSFQLLMAVTVMPAVQLIANPSYVDAGEPRTLFDGKSLEGWDGDPRFWSVENGAIVGKTTVDNPAEQNTFLIYRGQEFADFDISFQYQVRNYNSGFQYRSREIGEWSVAGYQSDFEARHHDVDGVKTDRFSGMFFDERGRMFLGQRGQAVIVRTNREAPKKPRIEVIGSVGDPAELESAINRDGWNEMRIIARGFTFTHIINGRVMSLGIDEDEANRRERGILAFQLHSGPPMEIRIKDIRITEL